MKISVVTPCFNEEANVLELHERIRRAFADSLPDLDYEHIFIDNASTDGTEVKLRTLAKSDSKVKVILNTRNFGHVRSPVHGLFQATGDAVIQMASDLQDPPEMIGDFVRQWKNGWKVVLAVKTSSGEFPLMFIIRRAYYSFLSRVSEAPLISNYTGFGLYDRAVIDKLKEIGDPYPYFRGLIAELGYPVFRIEFHQPVRKRGITSNNFYRLYDMAMLGITNHSKVPLRVAVMVGFATAIMSLIVAFLYLVAKLVFWDRFQLGIAPLIISIFFFASVQLFFIGIVGEYIGSIYTQVLKRPLVVEKERIGF
jgi:glycosyltransferase involved in cell wall biosynthesis